MTTKKVPKNLSSDAVLIATLRVNYKKFTNALTKTFKHKIVNIFFSISLNICFECSKETSHETVLLRFHNNCFGGEIGKLFFNYIVLS